MLINHFHCIRDCAEMENAQMKILYSWSSQTRREETKEQNYYDATLNICNEDVFEL